MKRSIKQKIGLILMALVFETLLVCVTVDFDDKIIRSPFFLGFWTIAIIAIVVHNWKDINLNEKYTSGYDR